MNSFKVLGFVTILLFGSFLYLFKIGEIPNGLGYDEVASGYNAYSLLLTGKDEYGKSFPFAFRFSNTYSPPLYTYLTVPMIALFDLSITSTRMVSVISGVFSIIIVFLVLKKMSITQNKTVPYLGMLLYTISPWTIMYSRSGYEAMLSFFIYAVGILFVWEGFKKPLFLTFGIIVLSISTYASHTNRFLVPLLLLGLFILFKDTFLNIRNRRFIVSGLLCALIIQIPNLFLLTTQSFFVKSNLFYSELLVSEYEKIRHTSPFFIGIPYLFGREFLAQYLTYFSPRSLFLDADPLPFRSIPNLSVFYSWMFIPYLVGLYVAWKNRRLINYRYLLLITLIAPIPAALTKDPFWTYRAIPLLLPLIIIISIGIDKILNLRIAKATLLLSFLIFASFILLWKGYFLLLSKERAKDWGYGYKQLAQNIILDKNETFIVDNIRNHLTYLQLAFFMKLPPEILHKSIGNNIKNNYYKAPDTPSNYSFANVEVRSIYWQKDVHEESILVGDELTFSEKQIIEHGLKKIFEIRDPLDKVLFLGYKTNPAFKAYQERQ